MTSHLPNSKIAEKVILSHILLNKPKLNIIFDRISPDMFYSIEYKTIYESACNLRKKDIKVNYDTVRNDLDSSEYDSRTNYSLILTELINEFGLTDELESYLILLIDKYLRRSLILSVQNVSKLAFDNSLSLETIFDQAEQLLLNVTTKKPNLGLLPASEVLLETFLDLEKRSKSGQSTGVPSGFFDLDALTQGFQKSDLIIIAGRPSMGKTAFALNIARNVSSLQYQPVVVFSLEMSRNQIVYRLLSNESGITNSKLRSGNLSNNEWNSISKSIASLSDLNIYLDDKSDITISDIRFKLNALQSRFGNIGLVVIDYLQLISDSHLKDSRVQELSRITRSLKLLAKDFNVPIIVLSQLSRNVESRTNKKPLLSDLRESGCFSLSTNLYTSFQRNKKVYPIQNLNKNDFQLLGLRQKKQSLSLSKSRVKSIFPTGFNFTYKLMIFGHHLVKLTNNHKVLTQHGWKKVKYLSKLDLISVLDKYNFIHFLRKGYHLNIFSFFTFIQISNIVPFCKEIVYDCWLPLTNSFLGNGYILHNSIEQDADLVLMLYREDYYSQDKKENNDLTHVIIAKHRNGPIGKINLIFDPITASFNNLIN